MVIRPDSEKLNLKLFVGYIPKEWDQDMIKEFFSHYGDIISTSIIRDKEDQYHESAIVEFASLNRAENAKKIIQSIELQLPGTKNRLQIRWADGEESRLGIGEQTVLKAFVCNLPKNVNSENLKDVFSQFGDLEESVLMKEVDGTSKGCAFLKFKNKESALLTRNFFNSNIYLGENDEPVEVRIIEDKSDSLF